MSIKCGNKITNSNSYNKMQIYIYIYIYIYSLRHSIKRIKHQRCVLTDMKEKKNVKIKKKKKKQE